MRYTAEELVEAKRQIDSTLHKTRQMLKTLSEKENSDQYKPQITLAKRRINAFEIAIALIEQEISADTEKGVNV